MRSFTRSARVLGATIHPKRHPVMQYVLLNPSTKIVRDFIPGREMMENTESSSAFDVVALFDALSLLTSPLPLPLLLSE